MIAKKEVVIEEREALIEMYKCGFLDGYSKFNKLKTKDDWELLNKFYKLAFDKRFGNKITKALKKGKADIKTLKKDICKGVKTNGRKKK